eukprot:TRINITY_DN9350_c0_g1_i1.p1 TRINITY_DN9350_c0_g1~~TRINITY_DN9350_c0_g1_i1.p1  ORF type:complete len:444 (+),score=51.74 TRINITY_DN9350_c0_g1_i1:68-1399(+)
MPRIDMSAPGRLHKSLLLAASWGVLGGDASGAAGTCTLGESCPAAAEEDTQLTESMRVQLLQRTMGATRRREGDPPCRADEAAAVCTASPQELCYLDESCAQGGLGCAAGGYPLCRFCGFGPFGACPGQDGFHPSPSPPPGAVPTRPTTTNGPSTTPPPGGTAKRLIIINGCEKDELYIANFAGATPYYESDIKIEAGRRHTFEIPNRGLAATRFWPKWGCDETGSNCKIGQSGGPGESCPEYGCAPPVDSKFEATFGCLPSVRAQGLCEHNPSDPVQELDHWDWWDVSQVDGWTVPYKVELKGSCDGVPRVTDCSHLSLDHCPDNEDLGSKYGVESLRLTHPVDKNLTVGCYSPCAKLTYSHWGEGYGHTPESREAQWFCCPTPPITPEQCSAGPVATAKYTEAVHHLCPGVYAYAYDDGVGLNKCPASEDMVYEVTFYCPA